MVTKVAGIYQKNKRPLKCGLSKVKVHQMERLRYLTKEQLIKKHNELIEEIWYLQHSLKQKDEEYELMLNAYENVSDKLYG